MKLIKNNKNRKTKCRMNKFRNSIKRRNEKLAINDIITLILYGGAVLILFLLFAVLGVSKDLKILENNLIDNIIGFAALLFSISTIPCVNKFLKQKLKGPKIIVKLWYIIIILGLPFYLTAIMRYCGFSDSIGNILGILGIGISIFTW